MTTAIQEPLRLSWSRVRTHEECHQKNYLQMSGHRSPISDIRGYFHGTVADMAMRRWLDQPVQEPGWMEAHVDEILAKSEKDALETGDGAVRWKHAADRAEVREFCHEVVKGLEPILYERVVPFDFQPAVRFEVPLTIPYLDGTPRQILLVGEMDILVRSPDGFRVWDLKATRDNDYWKKTQAQLVFYEVAVKGMRGPDGELLLAKGEWPVESGLIQPACNVPVMPFTFTAEDRRQLMGRVVKTATDLWRGDRSPKAGTAGCAVCNVRHACINYAPKRGRGSTTT